MSGFVRLSTSLALLIAFCISCGIAADLALAQNTGPAIDVEEVARWEFGSEENTKFTVHGTVLRDQPGPRPPQFPDFPADNTALRFPGDGSHLVIADEGADSRFDFGQGEALTLEAWVKVTDVEAHEYHVVVAKGRTGNKGFSADNQNWALRIRRQNGKGHLNFLFASDPNSKDEEGNPASPNGHWHRWTSETGFEPGSGWHHIAIAYRFGEPDSLKGWLDGVRVKGAWDMAGPTKAPPVVDNDEIWIGASQSGLAANSLLGSVDSIVIHRGLVSDEVIKTRFRREGPAVVAIPETMPELGVIPQGVVRLTLHEGLASHTRWLVEDETIPPASLTYDSLQGFLLTRLPTAFDDWGMRDHWKVPVLARLASDIELPQGNHRLLLRARGLSRLWVDGKLVVRTGALTGSPSGEEPMTPLAIPPRPGMRLPGYRQQEVIANLTLTNSGPHRMVLETMVGGKGHRPDTGEIVIAIEPEGMEEFFVLNAQAGESSQVRLTDEVIEPVLKKIDADLGKFDTQRRQFLANSQEPYWVARKEYARKWLENKYPNHKPADPDALDINNPIDFWIDEKINAAKRLTATKTAGQDDLFHNSIWPIFEEHCNRCHGQRALGGLQLRDRESIVLGGVSGLPGVTPMDCDESEVVRRVSSVDPSERMPPVGEGLKAEQIELIKSWIITGAPWPARAISETELTYSPLLDDAAFLRKVCFDTIGVPPTEEEVRRFLADQSKDKRRKKIDALLMDSRWADHWMPYWQDVLAENPTLINASLNSTGPFRWFLWDALKDGKGLDRWVSELVMLRGNPHTGGAAGFALAGENDAPFATKAQILASAFLGVELQCARCHDSPYHSTTQRDLFSVAAMLERKQGVVPKSSRVPAAFFEKQQRVALIKATLKPDEQVAPAWPFEELVNSSVAGNFENLLRNQSDSREQLALLLTVPDNERFAQVVVNRIWRKLIGIGLVEPPNDWEGSTPSHPELLQWLSLELVRSGYQVKHVERLILNSRLYQRLSRRSDTDGGSQERFFNAPAERRLSAEQVVDAMYHSTGNQMELEELTFDPDGRRAADNRISLGYAQRAWMLPSLANERDRPSLNLPKAQAVATVLEAFGWSGARQSARTDREMSANVLQPGAIANGVMATWLTRAAYNSELSQLAINATSPNELLDSIFLRFLSRFPTPGERESLVELLAEDFDQRMIRDPDLPMPVSPPPLKRVTWSNHLIPEANAIQLEMEKRARSGPPVEPRLRPQWRERYEDVVWGILNTTEFVWLP